MVYFISFVITLLVLICILTYGKIVDVNMILLVIIVAIGNGGFYALSRSTCLEEAILANTICYVIGIFAPVTVFYIVCSICRIRIPLIPVIISYLIQTVIYLTVTTVGVNGIFYKTVEFHQGPPAYLTKTYGPMHTAYIVSMIFYTAAGLVIGLISLERRTIVSGTNVTILVFVNMLMVGVYLVERLTHLKVELMPVAYVISLFVLMIPLLRVYVYSVYNNQDVFAEQIRKTGYIVFNRRLKYMGCSEYAVSLFPELRTWQLEKRIPGSGGRFNTFLRQPLLDYKNAEPSSESVSGTYEYKDEIYNYEIGDLYTTGKRIKGYIIRVTRITEAVKGSGK